MLVFHGGCVAIGVYAGSFAGSCVVFLQEIAAEDLLTIDGQLQVLGVRSDDAASVRRATDAVNVLLESGLRAPAPTRRR